MTGAEELFRANLALVERVIGVVCRRAGLRDADAEDFSSTVKLALIENDYAILRGYEGRAPLGAFLTVVVQRMLSREWMRLRGRWHPSAEAERRGIGRLRGVTSQGWRREYLNPSSF